MSSSKPRVLVSNDDGIDAPGLVSLVEALVECGLYDVYVCAPSGERSAQSHAITLRRYLTCNAAENRGSVASFAVDGTPADSVMLALHGTLFQGLTFDLVVSGINRGDNCGLHVIYSGTVGAAREAACQGIPSVAFSLDNHRARSKEDYITAAKLSLAVVKALMGESGMVPSSLKSYVLNVNLPSVPQPHGFYLTHQGRACVFPSFMEVKEQPGPHMEEIEEHTPNSRVFRNYAGEVQSDHTEGSDMWAVREGWVSVTPLGLSQDIRPPDQGEGSQQQQEVLRVVGEVVKGAGAQAGLRAKI